MFDPMITPRVYGVALGQDFSTTLYDGLMGAFSSMAPTDVARVDIYVNTRRMQRHLTSLFHQGNAVLLPRIRLVTDLSGDSIGSAIAPATAPLRRRLEVAQLVKGLIEADPTLAPQDSAIDLADSLVKLMSEMQGEGVPPERIQTLDVTDQSIHWHRALGFINLVQDFLVDDRLDGEGRQRRVIETLVDHWIDTPPSHPIIVAGSTGSRGATSLFMQAVAKLPQGAVILPGFDRDMPADVWNKMDQINGGEDHPQFRFKALCDTLGMTPSEVQPWGSDAPVNPERTGLISLSLRPAPVTHQWINDGPGLGDLGTATSAMTLIEAPTPRAEADAIATCLRQAVEDNKTAALISPDRMLTRQVTAALDRWDIIPDDSAGFPLHLSAPGRFLRHVVDLMCDPLDSEQLLVLLRHPLCHSGRPDRGQHVLRTNALELELRRNGPPFPTEESLLKWADATADRHPERRDWVRWIASCVTSMTFEGAKPLADHIAHHIDVAERLSAGPDTDETGEIWKKAAGREASTVMSQLRNHAEAGGDLTAREYRRLVNSILAEGEVRDRDQGHPNVLIWGTLEARVQSADLVILAGLNEGTWPQAPTPDPWLNRTMRMEAGLLLPERRIGLSAHDYQQAVCAKEVVLSRAVRSDEAETVPSRWINRLTNLLGGLDEQGGPDCLDDMRRRGQYWIDLAALIAAPKVEIDLARRPSPCPPTDARPTQLSVTQIKTLIRDPYAIYGRNILGLKALDPLAHTPDAPLRGTIVHKVLERFVKQGIDPSDSGARDALLNIAREVLDDQCPWPAMRALWFARIADFTPHFLVEEQKRRAFSANIDTEMHGSLKLANLPFTLTGTADRIDKSNDGEALIYDYKTGKAPSKKQQKHFDKQLLLEAAMVEQGAFKAVGAIRTQAAIYIGLGGDLKDQPAPLNEETPSETLVKFAGLIAKWMDPKKGYTSRSANETLTFQGDYDHLARYGEWDETDDPISEVL